MAFLDVHANPNPKSWQAIPYLLDVQADLLASLETRVVVPLYRQEAGTRQPIGRLTPVVPCLGRLHVAMVPELAGVARRDLGAAVGDLRAMRSELLAALDLLFTGS
jgi:toxin CcdB